MSDIQQQDPSTTPVADRPPVETLTFEQAQAELEHVVEALEDRHTGLDDALALWERGEALHAWCQSRLDYAADRLQKIAVTNEEVASVTAESGDAFAPGGAVPAAAAADPAPASTPADTVAATPAATPAAMPAVTPATTPAAMPATTPAATPAKDAGETIF